MPFPWRATALLVTSLSLGAGIAACAHELPPEPVEGRLDSLPTGGEPAQLTRNAGADRGAAFTRDGAAFWYSWERVDRADHDFCLGLLPVNGGTRREEICHPVAAANPDSTNWYLWAAPHPDGRRLAWFRLSSYRWGSPLSFPFSGEIVIATPATDGTPARIDSLQGFPILVAPGHFHQQPEHLLWANDSTLVYLAVLVAVEFGQSLPQDTLRSGVELGTLTLTSTGVKMGYVPGTTGASGVAVAPDGSLYFTLNGDNRIFHTTLAGGTPTAAFDAGPGTTVARDPEVHDTVAYLIVDGDVTDRFLANIGDIQSDGGGQLWRVSATGRGPIDTTMRWRRPVVSPDGTRLIAEGTDTLTGRTDLYELRLH